MSTCVFPDCGRPVVSGDLCVGHTKQRQRGRTLAPLRAAKPPTGCAGPSCDRMAVCGAFCRAHYRQSRTGKELTPVRPRQPRVGTCPAVGVDGEPCGRDVHSRGLCASHRRMQLRGEQLRPVIPRSADRVCDVDGCGRPHVARGFCDMHRYRHMRGLPLTGPVKLGGKASPKPIKANAPKAETRRRSLPVDDGMPPGWHRPTLRAARPAPEPTDRIDTLLRVPVLDPHTIQTARSKLIGWGAADLLDMLGLELAS